MRAYLSRFRRRYHLQRFRYLRLRYTRFLCYVRSLHTFDKNQAARARREVVDPHARIRYASREFVCRHVVTLRGSLMWSTHAAHLSQQGTSPRITCGRVVVAGLTHRKNH